EKIDVGTAAPQPLEQEAICYLLAEKAREGRTVARLKWGDPFVFDRGGTEALFLHEQGVRFQVVPGVPAGVAVPSYAGVPITHAGNAHGHARTPDRGDQGVDRTAPFDADRRSGRRLARASALVRRPSPVRQACGRDTPTGASGGFRRAARVDGCRRDRGADDSHRRARRLRAARCSVRARVGVRLGRVLERQRGGRVHGAPARRTAGSARAQGSEVVRGWSDVSRAPGTLPPEDRPRADGISRGGDRTRTC